MNLRKGLVRGIVLVLGIFWTSVTLASSISMTLYTPYLNIGGDIPGVPADYREAVGGTFAYQSITPGIFSQTGDGGGGWASIYWTSHGPYPVPGPDSYPCCAGGSVEFSYALTQEGPLRFTSASWTATLIVNGTKTLLFHADADADLIKYGGIIPQMSEDGTHDPYPTVGFDLGITELPITWIYNMIDPDHPELGSWYDGSGSAGVGFFIRLDLSGTMIDTTAAVPLPPAWLLLSSALGGLAIYGPRKVIG